MGFSRKVGNFSPVTAATWMLPSKAQWEAMGAIEDYNTRKALCEGFSDITGASNLQFGSYWSSTENITSSAQYFNFFDGGWAVLPKINTSPFVRACLAF